MFIAPLDEEPTVRITKIGRFTYEVAILHGLMAYGAWFATGRKRAERKGRRQLTRYLNRLDRRGNQWEISGDTR